MPEPSVDRALRALADAAEDFRPRVPQDAADPAVPVAATVLLLRDADAGGVEVLMIERPDRGSFAGAWVFPGGKLEPGDARAGASETEETTARRAGVRETAEETGLEVAAGSLVALSCWDPPPGLALRIRTWFFIGPDPGGEPVLSADEAVAAEWAAPADMLRRHGQGAVTLYPPTWVTLHGLVGRANVEEVVGTARTAGVERFETVARRGAEGPLLLWQGDAEFDDSAPGVVAGTRHRLDVGRLPWVYLRDAG